MGLGSKEVALLLSIRAEAGQAVSTMNQVNNAANKVGYEFLNASRRSLAFSEGFRVAGQSLERAGMAILAGGATATKALFDFERGLRAAQTQTDMTEGEFRKMEDAMLELGSRSALPLEQLNQGLYDIFSTTNLGSKQAVKALDLFQKAATAGSTDIRTVSRAAIGEMNAFGMQAGDLNSILDQQFELVRLGGGTYEEFAQALGLGTSAAVAAGQSIQSFHGMLELLTRSGMSASESVTSASRALDLITRPEIAQNLKKTLGVDVIDKATGDYKQIGDIMGEMANKLDGLSQPEQAKVFEKIFGAGEIRANRFFRIAIPRIDQFQALLKDTGSSAGAMEEAFDKMMKSDSVRMDVLINALKVVGIQLVRGIIPAVRDVMTFIAKLVDWFSKLPDSTKEAIGKFILFGGVVALISGKVLTLISAFQQMSYFALRAGSSLSTIIKFTSLWTVAIIAVVAAVALIITHWEDFVSWWKENWGTIKAVAAAVVTFLIVAFGQQAVAAMISFAQTIYLKVLIAIESLAGASIASAGAMGTLKNVMRSAQVQGAMLAVAVFGFIKALEHMNNVLHGNEEQANTWAEEVASGQKSMADVAAEADAATKNLSAWDVIMHKDTEAMNTFALAQEKIKANFEALVNQKMPGSSAASMFLGTDEQLQTFKELQEAQKLFDQLADEGAQGAEEAYQQVTNELIRMKDELFTMPFEQFAGATGNLEGSVSALNGIRNALMGTVKASDEAKISILSLTNQFANMQGGITAAQSEVVRMYLDANNLAGAEEYLKGKIEEVTPAFEKQIGALLSNKNAHQAWGDTVSQAAMNNRALGMSIGESINKIYAQGGAIKGADAEILKAAIDTGNWGKAFAIVNSKVQLTQKGVQQFTHQILSNANAYKNWSGDVVRWTQATSKSNASVKKNVGSLAMFINRIHDAGIAMGKGNAEYIRGAASAGQFGKANARAAHTLASGLIKNLDKAVKSQKNLDAATKAEISNAQQRAKALIDQASKTADASKRTELYAKAVKILDQAATHLPKTKTIDIDADTQKAINDINNLDKQLQTFVNKQWQTEVDVYYTEHGDKTPGGDGGYWTHRNYASYSRGKTREISPSAALARRTAAGVSVTIQAPVEDAEDVRRELEWAWRTRGW